MRDYIIDIEKDSTGDGRYQLKPYINGNSIEPLNNITSFNEIHQYAIETKEYIEKELNVKLPYDVIKISKDVLDAYADTDIELKEFLKHNDIAPKTKKGRFKILDIIKKYLS